MTLSQGILWVVPGGNAMIKLAKIKSELSNNLFVPHAFAS